MRITSIVKAIALCAATFYAAHLFDTGNCTCGRMISPATAEEASQATDTSTAPNASAVIATPGKTLPASTSAGQVGSGTVTAPGEGPASSSLQTSGPRPKLVDLGAGKCKACKEMAPVLEQAKVDYAGIADVEFIDVWENRDAGAQYGIRMIPTQIFYDAQGKEMMRHEGFLPREEIDRQFEALGVKLPVKAP
ncbi:MAG TPA: thioredoxin family protein [Candidatus Ozemobacteraceae bacterium]|nr:thioredoxin family protein [Candidatus Ozemobacteraceae bacterium]